MKENALRSSRFRRFRVQTTDSRHAFPVAPNRLNQQFDQADLDRVWVTDITYVPMRHGFMYLTAVIDWYSRYVLSWRLSNTLDGGFCLEALDEALSRGRPEIFNTDQGSQFTSREYTGRLEEAGIAVSRDGRGRALDNAFVERLWRSVKY